MPPLVGRDRELGILEQSLADAYVYPDAEPYALYDDADEMVGFALLLPLPEGGPADSVPPGATLVGYVVVRLMIDARFQGRGYGGAAVDAIDAGLSSLS